MTLDEAQLRIKELEQNLEDVTDELDDAKSDISDLEDDIDKLKEEVKMWEDGDKDSEYIAVLEIIADESNWTSDAWTPVLNYLSHPADMANEVLNANK